MRLSNFQVHVEPQYFRVFSLTSVAIPNSATNIEEDVFEECGNLQDITLLSSLAKQLPNILPKTKHTIVLHMEDITEVSTKYRPGAAAGFAEDGRSCTDENGKNTASTSNPTPRSWSNWPLSIPLCST